MLLCGHTHLIQLTSALPCVHSTACARPCTHGGTSAGLMGLLSSLVQWELALKGALLGARAPAGLSQEGSGVPQDAEPKRSLSKSSLLCLEWQLLPLGIFLEHRDA